MCNIIINHSFILILVFNSNINLFKIKRMSNYINAEIDLATITEVLGHLTAIKTKIPFLLKLETNTKKSLVSMDDSRSPFVAKCLQYGLAEPNIVPPYIDLEELKSDLDLFNNLQSIAREINRLADMVNDTRIAAGTDAYVSALSLYNSVKQASKMNVPGTKPVFDDLKKLFDGQGVTAEQATAKV